MAAPIPFLHRTVYNSTYLNYKNQNLNIKREMFTTSLWSLELENKYNFFFFNERNSCVNSWQEAAGVKCENKYCMYLHHAGLYMIYNEGGSEIRPWTNQYLYRDTGNFQNLFRTMLWSYSEPLNFVPNPALFSCIFLFISIYTQLESFYYIISRRGAIQQMLISCPQNFKAQS